MIGQLLRRVRDAFAPGAAERRFRRLESDVRDLLVEIDSTMEKLAVRAATDAKRRSRAAAAALEAEEAPAVAPEAPPSDDLAARKAAARKRAAARGTVINTIIRRADAGATGTDEA